MIPKAYIGVLLGAGPRLSSATSKALKALVQQVFTEAQAEFDQLENYTEFTILDLTTRLARTLEDSEYTNAGKGSELTLRGSIECDASIILGSPSLVTASVGAVPNIGHPTDLCAHLIKSQLEPKTAILNRSVPTCIVGPSAREYGVNVGLISADPEPGLISERARYSFNKWRERIDAQDLPDKFMDTIGIIVIVNGITCVVSSSGGALLKDPGRVGPAFVIGAGLDCQGPLSAVCSGFGEDIITSRLASFATKADQELSDMPLHAAKYRLQRPPAQFGILRSTVYENEGVFFDWIHTTPSMICGFGSVCRSQPLSVTTITSQRPQQGGQYVR